MIRVTKHNGIVVPYQIWDNGGSGDICRARCYGGGYGGVYHNEEYRDH